MGGNADEQAGAQKRALDKVPGGLESSRERACEPARSLFCLSTDFWSAIIGRSGLATAARRSGTPVASPLGPDLSWPNHLYDWHSSTCAGNAVSLAKFIGPKLNQCQRGMEAKR